MNLLDDEIARTLADHAHDAPTADGLLPAVHRRNRQRTVRRRTAGALAALAVVAGGSLAAGTLDTGQDPTVLAWQNAAQSGFLIPTDLRPSFPLTPFYLPPAVQSDPRLSAERGSAHAAWERQEQGRDGALSGISVAVLPQDPGADELAPSEPVEVNGQAAALVRYEGAASVRWQRAPRQWLDVTAFAPLVAEDALAVARSLKETPLRQPAEFDIAVAPEGFVLVEHHQGGVTLGPPDGVPNPQDDPRAVVVVVRQASSDTDGHGEPVQIGERSGWLDQRNGRYDLVLRLDDSTRLQITTPASGEWNREELARFAVGVAYTGGAPRIEG